MALAGLSKEEQEDTKLLWNLSPKKRRSFAVWYVYSLLHLDQMINKNAQICFEAQAPSGYTFIPAGNPQLTTTCKERCRAEGLQIHAVSVRTPSGC
jgi:hypothetical protein